MNRALLQAWQKTLRRHGDTRAVVEAASGRSMTFRELDAAAEAWVATHVVDRAALAGRAVVFAQPNGIAWLEMFLGLLKVGAVVVPLDPGEPQAAQPRLAERLRAAFWWDGAKLQPLARPRRYRDPAMGLIKLTSGSTGQPRALVFTDAQMLAD